MTLNIKSLIPELQKVANEELGEIPTRIAEDLQALKECLKQQPHLKSIDDDALLLQFLRGSKHSLERAKGKIDHWSAFPEKFVIPDVTDEKFQKFLKVKSFLALPMPLNDCGPRIIIARVNFNAKEYTPVEVIRYAFATLNVMIVNDPYACIYGCVYFLDLTDITTEHILDYNLSFFKRFFIPLLGITPIRFKGIYILNTPARAIQLVKIIATFLPDKISKRLIHQFGCHNRINSRIRLPQLNRFMHSVVTTACTFLSTLKHYYHVRSEIGTKYRII